MQTKSNSPFPGALGNHVKLPHRPSLSISPASPLSPSRRTILANVTTPHNYLAENELQTPSGDAKLRVSEVFESLQGEGVNIGTPSTFLRLALCNLRCTWCDTKYTWDWQHYNFDQEVKVMSAPEVATLVGARKSANVVITGGEPLLQQRQLVPVLRELATDHTFELETAGTLAPSDDLIKLIHTWNISPKLANSGNALQARRRPEPLRRLAQLENAFFKFVMQAEDDIKEVLELVDEFCIPSERVFLMPEATDAKDLQKKADWLAQLCIQHQFRLGYRLHVALWGNRRGV